MAQKLKLILCLLAMLVVILAGAYFARPAHSEEAHRYYTEAEIADAIGNVAPYCAALANEDECAVRWPE